MSHKFTICVVLLAGILTGCNFSRLPNIPAHHWRRAPFGAELYTDSGHNSASFIGSEFGDGAQACDFDGNGCRYFETDQQALKWLQQQYAAKEVGGEGAER